MHKLKSPLAPPAPSSRVLLELELGLGLTKPYKIGSESLYDPLNFTQKPLNLSNRGSQSAFSIGS